MPGTSQQQGVWRGVGGQGGEGQTVSRGESWRCLTTGPRLEGRKYPEALIIFPSLISLLV